jgi:hypothetical protein
MDSSDFIIIGSDFETQCLAALEGAARNKPVLMKPTGLLATLPYEDRCLIGIFNSDLNIGFLNMVNILKTDVNYFAPKKILDKYRLNSSNLRAEWVALLLNELAFSFIPAPTLTIFQMFKSRIPRTIKKSLRHFYHIVKG